MPCDCDALGLTNKLFVPRKRYDLYDLTFSSTVIELSDGTVPSIMASAIATCEIPSNLCSAIARYRNVWGMRSALPHDRS